jgi:integrase
MQGVFKFGRKEKLLSADFDPFRDIDCEASSDYEAITCTPEQTLEILNELEDPEFILTLLIAPTGLSISEALGLQWSDVEYQRNRIVVHRSWFEEIGNCKNVHRKAPVAMHPLLGGSLKQLAKRDYVREAERLGLCLNQAEGSETSLRKHRQSDVSVSGGGKGRGVPFRRGAEPERRSRPHPLLRFGRQTNQTLGGHNLRHSLASWLVSNGVDVKTVSSMLRHSNVKTTLGIYSHAVDSNKLAAQGQFLNTLLSSESVQ